MPEDFSIHGSKEAGGIEKNKNITFVRCSYEVNIFETLIDKSDSRLLYPEFLSVEIKL